MDRKRVAVLGRPLVHVDDLRTDPGLLQEQRRDETDRTGTDDEDLRIGVIEHRASSRGQAPFLLYIFDERCKAILSEVLARVEEDQDDDHGARSNGKGRIVEPSEAVV